MTPMNKRLQNRQAKTRRPTASRRLLVQSLEDRRLLAAGPYAPAAGQVGSTAIDKDDSAIVGWATSVTEYLPGDNLLETWKTTSNALGPAEGVSGSIVSLGSGGSLTLSFDTPIRDGLGADFAVFENSFSDTFLELGFVEVSSDGVNFFRFDSDSLTSSSVGAFGSVDPTNLNNLAGKYRGGFGTPFDLSELSDESGLDLTAITHVRLIDIIGDGVTQDTSGDPIYDPTPTAQSAGLDVDGVAVLHAATTGETTTDFETLGGSLGGATFSNNAGGSFTEDDISLNNNYTNFGTFDTWTGWAISQQTDTVTPGYLNQYSAITGAGHEDSPTYAVGFFDVADSNPAPPPTITLDPASNSQFDSLYVTNTTYAYLSILHGDSFAAPFGGEFGNEPDLFQLIVTGLDANGSAVGNVTVDLADYRFDDNTQDTIIDKWTYVDVSSLVDARSLQFSMTSTGMNAFGITTPAYFAVDDVTLVTPTVPLDLEQSTTQENQSVTARVSRPTTDTSLPMEISLSGNGTDQVSFPETVTIPAGSSYVEFEITPNNDSVFSPDRILNIEATVDHLLPTTSTLTIQDDEVLGLAFDATVINVTEGSGEQVSLVLTRNDADVSDALTVSITHDATSLLSVPSVAIFAAGSREATLVVGVLDDAQLVGDVTVGITATNTGHASGTINVNIAEDDTAALQVSPALVQLSEDSPQTTATITVSRNTANVDEAVTVTLASLNGGPLTLPASVEIPAGATSVDFEVGVDDDGLENTLLTYEVQVSGTGFASSTFQIEVADNDEATLNVLALDGNGDPITSIDENASFDILVRRSGVATDQSQTIDITGLLDGQSSDLFTGPTTITIPSGQTEATATYQVAGDNVAAFNSTLTITASAASIESATTTLTVNNTDLGNLQISFNGESLSESNALVTADFESLGRGLLVGEYDNNAGTSGQFQDNSLSFQNSFSNAFGFDSWSGFSISRATDSTTPGYFNQYSAFPGMGADGTSTYGIAFASSAVQVNRPESSAPFSSLDITNTTYAALSMRDGDSFAKQFGGESGNDEDFFLLTIDGLDADGDSIGQVEFYMADYRFADNSLDYIIDQWTSVDVSSIGDAVTLSMQLSSSDNGTYGMNTPGYFAIDNVALAPTTSQPSLTITRVDSDNTEALEVTLGEDSNQVGLPTTVTIQPGQSSVTVPLDWSQDQLARATELMTVTAMASGFNATQNSIDLVDDTLAALTVSVSDDTLEESTGTQTIGFEDTGANFAAESFNNGSDQRGGFESGSLMFPTSYNPTWGNWSGWAASNVTDVTTAGYGNQFAAYANIDGATPGGGADGSSTFAIGGGSPTLSLPTSLEGAQFESISITNTTYTALSMLQGDSFAKKFGGETGDDPDFLLLTITGFDTDNTQVATQEFYLADYRFDDNSLDYIVDDWTTVDLSSMADASQLQFSLTSSDVGQWGMNTPAFFAIDNLVVNRDPAATPSVTIHRNTADLSEELTVALAVDAPELATIPSTVTFPAGVDRVRVPITVIDDTLYQLDSQISVTATPVEPSTLLASSVSLTILNDDLPSILVEGSQDNFDLNETESADVFTVQLQAQPESDVVVTITNAATDSDIATGQIEITTTQLTFTPDNWDQPQTVTMTGLIDLALEPTQVIPIALSSDSDAFSDAMAWVSLQDYQPSELELFVDAGITKLRDSETGIVFGEFDNSGDVTVNLNDAAQQLTLNSLTGNRGLIEINVGGGDDTVIASTSDFTLIDGGDGSDTLVIAPTDLAEDESINLVEWLRHRAVHFETIVLGSADSTSNDSTRFELNADELSEWFGDTPPQLVTSANQVLGLSGDWQLGLPTLEDGLLTGHLTSGGIDVSVSTQNPWQNFLLRADVDASGEVVALDALMVINRINSGEPAELPTPQTVDEVLGHFYDVSGDGYVTPTDALQVINYLYQLQTEGESLAGAAAVNGLVVGEIQTVSTAATTRSQAQSDGNNPRTEPAVTAQFESTKVVGQSEQTSELTQSTTLTITPSDSDSVLAEWDALEDESFPQGGLSL
ncbi:Calx-beta domain-containing protein [Neorhodopirellula lusitana]|uniref:Calx-beta domain-containing protein n=2 Tax=Neorhodopirellula lusitana TaxID=445327 RepID=A0ABY1QBA1_9BACT|nr:Calx-beta domain-containing protein [Neorhodopirellula lusitana]